MKKSIKVIMLFMFCFFLFNVDVRAEKKICPYKCEDYDVDINIIVENNSLGYEIFDMFTERDFEINQKKNEVSIGDFKGNDCPKYNLICNDDFYCFFDLPSREGPVDDGSQNQEDENVCSYTDHDGLDPVYVDITILEDSFTTSIRGSSSQKTYSLFTDGLSFDLFKDHSCPNLHLFCRQKDLDVRCSFNKEDDLWKDDFEIEELYKDIESNNVNCSTLGEVIKDLQGAFNIFKILAPIIVVAMSTYDFIRAITGKVEGDTKKAFMKLVKRLLFALILFFLPTILDFFLGLVDPSYSTCING